MEDEDDVCIRKVVETCEQNIRRNLEKHTLYHFDCMVNLDEYIFLCVILHFFTFFVHFN